MDQYRISHPTVDPVDHTHALRFGGHCYEYGIGIIDHDRDFQPTPGVDLPFCDSDRDNATSWNTCTAILFELMPTVPISAITIV
jgi:hypothetical protein